MQINIKSSQIYILIFLILTSFIALFLQISFHSLSYVLSNKNNSYLMQLNNKNPLGFFEKASNILLNLKSENKNNPDLNGLNNRQKKLSKEKVHGNLEDLPSNIVSKLLEESRYAIAETPLDAKLYRLDAQINTLNKNMIKVNDLMAQAARLSVHEVTAQNYMFLTNFQNRKFDAAIYYADRLFSAAPEFMEKYKSQMSFFIENDLARKSLINYLALNPLWRNNFFSKIIPQNSSYYTEKIRILYNDLKLTKSPASNLELTYFINNLIYAGQYQMAYKIWREYFPPDSPENLNYINNGSFEKVPTGLPFDWNISSGNNVLNRIVTNQETNSEHVLQVEITRSRVVFPKMYEYIFLMPGNYHFKGKYKGDISGKRGLTWNVNCVNGNYEAASNEIIGRSYQWIGFGFDFTIPDKNCEGQILSLKHTARSASEEIIFGSLWFDDLSIGVKE